MSSGLLGIVVEVVVVVVEVQGEEQCHFGYIAALVEQVLLVERVHMVVVLYYNFEQKHYNRVAALLEQEQEQ